jgi:hypothetical protein
LRQLHSLLETVEDEISDKIGKQLCELPIWPDRQGQARSLKGHQKALIPENEDLCQLFPLASFLDNEVCRRKHIKRLGVAYRAHCREYRESTAIFAQVRRKY